MRALAGAPREVVEYATPLMLSLHPSYLGASYWRTLAALGRLDVLQWGTDTHGFRPTAEVAITAARSGHVHILQWLHELAPWTTETTHALLENAASCGQISVIDWLLARHDLRSGGAAACAATAAAGELHALVRLHVHGSAWDHDTFEEAAANGHTGVMEWLVTAGAPLRVNAAYRRAARHGQRASLEWMDANFNATPRDADVFSCAAKSGDLALLRWLRARGCAWDARASRVAATRGDMEALEWLHAAGAPLAFDACDVAYKYGRDEAFEWAYGHGLTVAAKTEVEMTKRGDVSRLEWLRVKGHVFQSPPDMWVAAMADVATTRWLIEHDFACDADAMEAALDYIEW